MSTSIISLARISEWQWTDPISKVLCIYDCVPIHCLESILALQLASCEESVRSNFIKPATAKLAIAKG
jgi:hypothetical protein